MGSILKIAGIEKLKKYDWEDLSDLSSTELIIRWVNYKLSQRTKVLRITRLEEDYSDSVILTTLLNSIFGRYISPEEILLVSDNVLRAEILSSKIAKIPGYSGALLSAESIYNNDLEKIIEFLVLLLFNHPGLESDEPEIVSEDPESVDLEISTSDSSDDEYINTNTLDFPDITGIVKKLEDASNYIPRIHPPASKLDRSFRYKKNPYLRRLWDVEYPMLHEARATNDKLLNEIRLRETKIQNINKKIQAEEKRIRDMESNKSKEKRPLRFVDLSINIQDMGTQFGVLLEKKPRIFGLLGEIFRLLPESDTSFNDEKRDSFRKLMQEIRAIQSSKEPEDSPYLVHLMNMFAGLELSELDVIKRRLRDRLRVFVFNEDTKSRYLEEAHETCEYIIKFFKGTSRFITGSKVTQKDLERSIRIAFLLFSYSTLFKRQLSKEILTILMDAKKIRQLGDEDFKSVSRQIFEALESSPNLVDPKRYTESLSRILRETFNMDSSVAVAIYKETRKKILSKIIRHEVYKIIISSDKKRLEEHLRMFAEGELEELTMKKFQRVVAIGSGYLSEYFDPDTVEFICGILDPNVLRESMEELANALIDFSETFGIVLPIIEAGIGAGVNATMSAGTLFRANSVTTKLVTKYFLLHGRDYLVEVLKEPIETIIAEGKDFEVNPNAYYDEDVSAIDFNENMKTLKRYFHMFMDKIFASLDKIPVCMRLVLATVKEQISKMFPDSVYSGVGGFFFLRFLCPVMVSPQLFGVLDKPVPSASKKGMLRLSTVVQSLSNGMTFSQNKAFMEPINSDIVSRFGDRRKFTEDLVSIDKSYREKVMVPYFAMADGTISEKFIDNALLSPKWMFSDEEDLEWYKIVAEILEKFQIEDGNLGGFIKDENLPKIVSMNRRITQDRYILSRTTEALGSHIETIDKIRARTMEIERRNREEAERKARIEERRLKEYSLLDDMDKGRYEWSKVMLDLSQLCSYDEFVAFYQPSYAKYITIVGDKPQSKTKKGHVYIVRKVVAMLKKRVKSQTYKNMVENYEVLIKKWERPREFVKEFWNDEQLQVALDLRSGGWRVRESDKKKGVLILTSPTGVEHHFNFEKKGDASKWEEVLKE